MSEGFKVSYRGGFADRYIFSPVNTSMQVDEFDWRTRVAIRNQLAETILAGVGEAPSEMRNKFWRAVLSQVYSQPVDYTNEYWFKIMFPIIEKTVYEDPYYDILSLIEFIISYFSSYNDKVRDILGDQYNSLFEREYVGYRYIANGFTKITDNLEVMELKEVLSSPYDSVKEHISKALVFLSDRVHPDYANSIKESITAVEAMCNIITGKNSTLGDMLKQLEKQGFKIHPCLREAFSKLYGFTTDANGIRHAGQLDLPSATFEEAKYMVVSCGAFVNYLICVQAK